MEELKITCKAHTTRPLSELKWFQGNLAEATKESKDTLESLLIKHGIFKAIDVWDDGEKLNIVDGHARKMVLEERFGYTDEQVPVNYVLAESYNDAKEKVLASRIQSNRTTEQGLYDFTQDLNWDEISDVIRDIPGIDLDQFEKHSLNDGYVDSFSLPDGDKPPFQQMTFTLHDTQAEVIVEALSKAKNSGIEPSVNENSNGNALHFICEAYLG